MFTGRGKPRKPAERAEARRLRRDEGMSIKRIATELGVSPSSVFHWTKDIELTPEQRHWNIYGPRGPQNPEWIAKRAAAWSERHRNRRLAAQLEGRSRARDRDDPLHLAGCMLYWAEGTKRRNTLQFCNSDANMLCLFARFLRETMNVQRDELTLSVNVYLDNENEIDRIHEYWLDLLGLPESALRKPIVNHMPTSSSGRKRNKLPFGVAKLTVLKSTYLLHHIYGAIQEYCQFDEPRWLDLPP